MVCESTERTRMCQLKRGLEKVNDYMGRQYVPNRVYSRGVDSDRIGEIGWKGEEVSIQTGEQNKNNNVSGIRLL